MLVGAVVMIGLALSGILQGGPRPPAPAAQIATK
jgi:hypothetical protein